MSILISHKNAPIHFLLNHKIFDNNDDDDEQNISVIHCQISSNLYFYTKFLSELSSSPYFSKLFYQLLIQLNNNSRLKSNRKYLKCLFSSIHHRQNLIYLQVHNKINRYNEWINRLW
jgi:hypothetical protein